jgi:hypothetical protein
MRYQIYTIEEMQNLLSATATTWGSDLHELPFPDGLV